MNVDRLLGHYERIADAPDAVPRLRRFILDLAVRGKLVEQDPNDEPAAISLVERKRHRSQREVRPLDVPGWLVAPVASLLQFQYGKGMKASERLDEGPVPVFGSNGLVGYCETPLTEAPAIIVGRKGSAGALNLCDGPSWTTDVAYFVEAPNYFDLRYLLIGLQTLNLGSLGKGVKPGLSRADVYDLPLSVPPLAEQHRIVAKVDELMALCDRLEAARTEREATRDRMAAASLIRLNAPDPDPAIFRNHAAFALENLVPLTTRRDQIKALRQTILSLAVRGKLVEQDPNDEPAAELLRRMDVARLEMLEAGYPNPSEAQTQLKKLSTQTVPDYVENLPTGWSWATLQQCAMLVVDCKNKTAPYSPTGIRLVRTTNVKDGKLNASDQKYVNQETYEVWSARCKPETGDILITREAPMGEVCLIPPGETICLGQRIMLVRLVAGLIDRNFMLYSLRDPGLMDRVQDKPLGMTVQHLRVGGIETLLVAVPPLDEQHSIVAKVDELMVLCDRLEATLATDGECRRRLLDALLHEVLPARRSRGHLTKRKTRAPKAIQRAARG